MAKMASCEAERTMSAKNLGKMPMKLVDKWTREQMEVLIDAYKEEECLYVMKNPNYHNKHLRAAALTRVVEKVLRVRNTDKTECKNKIHSLRNQFNAENAKRKDSMRSGVGAEDIYEPSLWYFKSLLFLEDHFAPRKSSSTLPDASSENLDDKSESEGFMDENGRLIVYHPEDSDDDFFQPTPQAVSRPQSPSQDSQVLSQASIQNASPAPAPARPVPQCPAPDPSRSPSPATSQISSRATSSGEEILMPLSRKRAKANNSEDASVNKILNKIDKYMNTPLPLPPCSQTQTKPGNRIVSGMKYVTDSLLSLKDKKRQIKALHDIMQIAREAELAELFEDES